MTILGWKECMGINTTTTGRNRASTRVAGLVAVALAALFLTVPSLAAAVAQAPAAAESNITITQTDSPDQGWFCLPGQLMLTRELRNTPEYYELIVHMNGRPCEPIHATAAIYGMPGNGVAWPQTLKETKDFTISKVGTTVIRFTKTCDPVQFDVVTGATPPVISPLGPWHGPLLFPFDMETSVQHWGCEGSTTTSTSPCENYAARQLAVQPPSVAPGQNVTVSGLGTPGTTLLVWIAPPAGSSVTVPSTTVTVPASGQWSTGFTVPADGPPGTWTANAQASDCEGVTSVNFTVTDESGGGGSNEPGGSSVPPPDNGNNGGDNNGGTNNGGTNNGGANNGGDTEVGGITADRDLPRDAVENAAFNAGKRADAKTAGRAEASKLAWTGSNVRIPVTIGITLLMVGVLLLLRSRRTADALR